MGTGRGGRFDAWTVDERIALLVQHKSGVHVSKLSLPGRSQKACVQEYYRLQKPEQRTTARRTIATAEPIAPSAAVAASLAQRVQRPRYFHEADNDIRARIDRQGVTAGLFGDPPAGRSALDQKQGAS